MNKLPTMAVPQKNALRRDPAWTRPTAWITLAALLLLLAFRLTSGEFLHESLAQKFAAASPTGSGLTVNIGPAYLTFYSAASLLLASAATALAGVSRAFRPRHLLFLCFLALIAIGALASTLHAANRFLAVVGTTDLLTALTAGYTIMLLCDLLGPRAKNIVIAALLAILALGCAKALLQYFMEFPDLMQYVKDHQDEALRANGIDVNNPLEVTLFLSRVKSQEVSGFTHLSNVFATQVIPLAGILAALLLAAIPLLKSSKTRPNAPAGSATSTAPSPANPRSRQTRAPILDYKSQKTAHSAQIQTPLLAYIGCIIVFLAAAAVLPLTDSKGGTVAGILAVLLTLAAGLLWKHLLRRWKTVMIAAALLTLLGAAAVLAYGLRRDTLPSQSLAFRWHYWTAAVPMIEQHPARGVGLNNFGDYYLQFKRPSSPEDVKDPHNFFVRFAAELGLPTMAIVAALATWLFYLAFRSLATPPDAASDAPLPPSLGPPLLAAAIAPAIFCAVWAWLHYQFAEEPNAFNFELTIIYAILGFGVFAAALLLLDAISARGQTDRPHAGLHFILFAAAISAACMLLYDQVNMALVDGPVAMLFWSLLGVAPGNPAARPKTAPAQIATPEKTPRSLPATLALALAALPLLAGIAVLFFLTFPIAQGTFAWDPTPYEMAYIRNFYAGNFPAARDALNQAIDRAPLSLDLLTQRIAFDRDRLHLPVADQIRHVLTLDRANAPIRISLATLDSDLPAPERAAILQQALTLNDTLPKNEIKRLSPVEIAKIQATITQLESKN